MNAINGDPPVPGPVKPTNWEKPIHSLPGPSFPAWKEQEEGERVRWGQLVLRLGLQAWKSNAPVIPLAPNPFSVQKVTFNRY